MRRTYPCCRSHTTSECGNEDPIFATLNLADRSSIVLFHGIWCLRCLVVPSRSRLYAAREATVPGWREAGKRGRGLRRDPGGREGRRIVVGEGAHWTAGRRAEKGDATRPTVSRSVAPHLGHSRGTSRLNALASQAVQRQYRSAFAAGRASPSDGPSGASKGAS